MKTSQRVSRNFVLLVLSQGLFLTIFVYLFVTKTFALRPLAVGMSLGTIVFGIGYWRVFRSMSREYWKGKEWPERSIDDEIRKRRSKAIQRLSRMIIFMQIALWGGLWMGRESIREPALWVGVAVNLSITSILIRAVLKLRRSLTLPTSDITPDIR